MIEPFTANWVAVVAVLVWPVVAVIFYATKPVQEATLWVVLGALLILPSTFSIKILMVPSLDKSNIPNLCAFVGCLCLAKPSLRRRARIGIVELLVVAYTLGPLLTSISNSDNILIGQRFIPGVGWYDGVSAALAQLLFVLPFFLGRRLFQRAEDTRLILKALVVAGLVYSVPMLFEVRMSPQLSTWIYSVFPTGMISEARYGGFRPVVFMPNGLVVAFFAVTSFLAATAFWRAKTSVTDLPPASIPAYLSVVIILCKSAGALVYTIVGGLMVLLMMPKIQVRLAVVMVSIGILYPMLRAADIFPSGTVLEIAAAFNEERAVSLKVRFDQEDQLLERALERPLLGWGRYGRSRVYEEETGKDNSLTDGGWIITLGQFGILGFLAQFGLLAVPVFRASASVKFAEFAQDAVFLAALALIVSLTLVEQLPNASISPWSWLLAGALLGRAEYIKSLRSRRDSSIYSRSLAKISTRLMGA
jgi:hypothetical protein